MTPPHLFALHEHESATRRFISNTINALIRAKDPVLSTIPTVRTDRILGTQNTMGSGEVVDGPPMESAMTLTIQTKDVVEGDIGGFIASLDAAAEEGVGPLVRQIFDRIGKLAQGAGTSIHAAGAPVSWDLVLRGFEVIEIEFDPAGNPVMPTLVMHPDMLLKFKALGPPTAEHERRLKELIDRKREEHNARQRHRRLS
jgi:hypothetical protein